MLSALAVVRSGLRSFGGDSSATTAPTSQGGGGDNYSSRRRGRRTPPQPTSSEHKQLRWNSCCSKTKIVVAPKPRPKKQPVNERKTDEKRSRKANPGEEAGTDSKAKKKSKRRVKRLTAKLQAQQQSDVAAVQTGLVAQGEARPTREERNMAKLKAAAEAATAKRITELSYIPGKWDKVPEQRTAEAAANLLQQTQEQE